jgi:pimeloyl-ACP methyl ester carboxylesterase
MTPHLSQVRRAAVVVTAASSLIAACAGDTATPLEPGVARQAHAAAAYLPTVSARWTGDRALPAGGTTLQARLAQPHGAENAGGAPTVVFLSGLDAEFEDWAAVQPAVAALAPAFAYDRAGVGRSGPVAGPRPSSAVADELREALRVAGLRPPYVLVAHSFAGFHARVFAHRFPRDVAGMVLVDATPEQILVQIPREEDDAIAATMRFPGAAAEIRATGATLAEVLGAPFPAVPLAVITNMRPESPEEPAGVRDLLYLLHDEWARQVATGVHLTTMAGHEVPRAAPQEVADAVAWVLARARRGR